MAIMRFSPSAIYGKIRNDISLPDGCVLSLPLAGNTTPEVGNTPATGGSVSLGWDTFDGMSVAFLEYDNDYYEGPYLTVAQDTPITGTASRSICFWAYPTNTQTYCNAVGMGASSSTGYMFNCGTRMNEGQIYVEFTTWGNDTDIPVCADDGKLHFFCFTFDSNNTGILNIYFDGNLVAQQSVSSINTESSAIYIGRSGADGWEYQGYLAGVKVFNTCLTAEDVATLYTEYTDGVVGYTTSTGFDNNGIMIPYHSSKDAGTMPYFDISTDSMVQISFDRETSRATFSGTSFDEEIVQSGVRSLKLSGSCYADILFPSGIDVSNDYWTMELWFRPLSTSYGSYPPILSVDNDRTYQWTLAITSSGSPVITYRGGGMDSGAAITLNEWHHARVTHGSGTHIICAYIDGVRFSAFTHEPTASQTVRIGQFLYGSAGSHQFNGNVDNFILRKLTAEELPLYNGETAPVEV